MVVGTRGGVGATTVATNLAWLLAFDKKRDTILMDLDLQDGSIAGCEALVRWRHPERGLVSPADFVPIAEETGLINPLGEWVLATACTEAARWPDGVKLAVNVSPVQFKSGTLALKVIAALGASGLPASRLELEITEAVLIRDDDAALAILHLAPPVAPLFVVLSAGIAAGAVAGRYHYVADALWGAAVALSSYAVWRLATG